MFLIYVCGLGFVFEVQFSILHKLFFPFLLLPGVSVHSFVGFLPFFISHQRLKVPTERGL